MIWHKKILTFFFILFLPNFVNAASIRQRASFLPNPQLNGLNTSISPLILDPTYLITATNVLYDHVGSRKKRGGCTYLNESSLTEASGSNAVMGIFDFRKISATGTDTNKLLCHSDGKIYKMESLDGTWDDITENNLTLDKQIIFATMRPAASTLDTVIMVNGAEIPQVWDQATSTVAGLTGYPTGVNFYPSTIINHRYRLFAAGVASYPYRVFYSAAYAYNDWNTESDAGYFDVVDLYGSKVTGFASYFGYLIVFTENSVFSLAGSTVEDFVLTPLILGLGAVNQASIVSQGNDIYFVSKKGIHTLSTTEKYGDILETYISSPIQNDFNNLRKDYLKNCCGYLWTQLNYIIWSFTENGRTANNLCYVYDYIGNRWSKWENINAASFGSAVDGDGKEILLAGNYDGFVNKLNQVTYNDNGDAIEMLWSTPYISFNDPVSNKGFRELFLYMKPQGNSNSTINYIIDDYSSESLSFSQAGAGGTFGTFRFGIDQWGGGTLLPRSQSLSGSGKTIQINYEQNDVNVGSETYGFAIEALLESIDYSN